MKTPIVFKPAKNPNLPKSWPDLEPVHAFQLAYGLVIHPAIGITVRKARGFWDVSDPSTGALVAYGVYPGPEGAIAGLVEKAMAMKNRQGGFRGALERARSKLRAEFDTDGGVVSGWNRTTSGAIGQP